MTDTLHQINIQYSDREDRILLRASTTNNDEFLVWLTRRFTILFLGILDKEIEKRGGTTSVSTRQETKRLFNAGAFEKPYAEEQPKNHPLGKHGLVANRIKTGNDQHDNLILEIQSESGQGITFNLDSTLLYMFYSLLNQGIERADWQIGRFPVHANKNLH